ncbi:helix-turn-helix domain-containing protein [Yersinia sp. 1252 StPb PI]|uniref:helix-turn-helix domain-containing protein n=2 Tax=unclassified Yersinia (in: enterobacteria) TaxID=2653513 RepID=UPI003B283F60
MNKSVMVVIHEKNIFFSLALQSELSKHLDEITELILNDSLIISAKKTQILRLVSKQDAQRYCERHVRNTQGNKKHTLFVVFLNDSKGLAADGKLPDNNPGIIYGNYSNNIIDDIIQNTIGLLEEKELQAEGNAMSYPASESTLTGKERTVMCYLKLGINPVTIAQIMKLSIKTVNAHKNSIMKKINMEKRIQSYRFHINEACLA